MVRSGEHDYEGISYISEIPFVMVDMINFHNVSVDPKDNTVLVQTGDELGQLYHTIAQESKTLAFSTDVCLLVGVGGYDIMSCKECIVVDNIINQKLINANDKFLNRKSMGEDLLWAIRGGKCTTFGIVLAFKVKLVDVHKTMTVFNVSRMVEQNATQLVHWWQYISSKMDENLLIFGTSSVEETTNFLECLQIKSSDSVSNV